MAGDARARLCYIEPTVLARFIGVFLCPDHRSKGLSIGWGHLLEKMVT